MHSVNSQSRTFSHRGFLLQPFNHVVESQFPAGRNITERRAGTGGGTDHAPPCRTSVSTGRYVMDFDRHEFSPTSVRLHRAYTGEEEGPCCFGKH